jgi:hypothetical protein
MKLAADTPTAVHVGMDCCSTRVGGCLIILGLRMVLAAGPFLDAPAVIRVHCNKDQPVV